MATIDIHTLSAVAHELRTPLHAILGFAELMRMERGAALSCRQSDCLAQIERSASHLNGVIGDLLDASRTEGGAPSLQFRPVPVDDVVGETLAMLRPMADRAGVAAGSDGAAGGCEPVWADRLRLRQVLINLIGNAIKYNRPGGRVRVGWAGDASTRRCRIEVSDTGIGLCPSQIERLFTPFDRLGAESTPVPGHGLGLVVTRSLVRLMDGSLAVRGEPGVGCTVTVELPQCLSID